LIIIRFSSEQTFDLHQVFRQKIKELQKDDRPFGYDEMRKRGSYLKPGKK
jgi:hypothetical protein